VNPTAAAALADCFDQLPAEAIVYLAGADTLAGLAGMKFHQGCLAVGIRRPLPDLASLIADARIVVVLESIANPDNVGGVFRNVAALGGDAVLLGPSSCDPLYRKAIRTSAGASLSVPFTRIGVWSDSVQMLRERGFVMAALTAGTPARSLDEWVSGPRPARVALMIGSEATGLSGGALELADVRLRIPMQRGVDSLNLSVAVGIVLSRLCAAPG
jgi:tRNA G18 (ribose-2'-O)-methylase SpoU